jgi:hypothetical protein
MSNNSIGAYVSSLSVRTTQNFFKSISSTTLHTSLAVLLNKVLIHSCCEAVECLPLITLFISQPSAEPCADVLLSAAARRVFWVGGGGGAPTG